MENTSNETTDPNIAKEITLSDGSKAVIYKGKGKHAQKAMRIAGDSISKDSTIYLSTLMSMLIKIDGKELIPEEFGDLDMKDYNLLISEFTEVNF